MSGGTLCIRTSDSKDMLTKVVASVVDFSLEFCYVVANVVKGFLAELDGVSVVIKACHLNGTSPAMFIPSKTDLYSTVTSRYDKNSCPTY